MYGTYLIAKDQLYLDKACRWVPLASTCLPLGYHKGVHCRVNLSTWLEDNGWNSSFCSNTFDAQGDKVLEDIRNKVRSLFHCKSDTECPNKSS